MHPVNVFCLLATLAAASSAAPMDQTAQREVVDHVRRVMNFRCGSPQERAVLATEVVDRRLTTNQTIWPPVTVLRRCDAGSGCCLGKVGQTCTAVARQNVTLYFEMVTPPHAGMGTAKREVFNVVVSEDTECDCRTPPQQDAH